MLKKLRQKKTAKKVWIVLCILILPAFVLWGSGSLTRNKQETVYAGKIFGRNVPLLEYKDAFQAVRNESILQFGDKFSEMQKYLNLERRAWQRLILLHEAAKRKISAGDAEVIEIIRSYPAFARKGRFDNRIYEELLRYLLNTQARIFEEQTRDSLILAKLYRQVTDGLGLSEEEIKKEYQKANEQISLYYLASLPADYSKGLSPGEEETKEYFKQNSLAFKQPISFNIEYLLLESEDKINEAAARLNKKGDFYKVAKGLGSAVKETGLFSQADPIPGIGWSPEILTLISRLKAGQFSPVIHADKNYYLLRLKERKETYIPDFEKIKDKVRERLIQDKSGKLAKAGIEEALTNPGISDFDKIAKDYGLKSGSTELFKYGGYIEGIGASDNFWVAGQGLKEDAISSIINIPSGFYIVKLKTRVRVDEKKFEDERPEFSRRLLSQKKEEYFAKFVEELSRQSGLQ